MPAIIPAIMAGTAIAGKIAESRAKGRQAEAGVNQQRDELAAQNYAAQLASQDRQRQQALDERKFQAAAPNQAMSQLLRGSLIQNYAAPHLSIPGIAPSTLAGTTGGSPFSADAQQGGGTLVKSAMDRLLKGEQFDPQQMLQAPTATPLPQSGGLDKWLGILGTAGSVGGAAYGAYNDAKDKAAAKKGPTGASPQQLFGTGGGVGGVSFR